MDPAFQTAFGLAGGLAVFLFGMNMMSEGLQKVAGQKMKSILGMLCANPVLGVLAGALITAVLQSSSATTVMVIGFVSARLMGLPQAIAVIFGANIGTTMTAQLMAFNLSDFVWAIVAAGFLIHFAFKNERVRNVGQTVFAFGLLFVGIDTMGDAMKPLAGSQVFLDLIASVSDVPALGVLVGAAMTLVVQSSSATIAVLQNFASQAGPDGVSSIIGLQGAVPILLGDNIGTTITALLACIGQSRDAKRTAVAHSVFNITGAFVFVWLIPVFVPLIQLITPGPELEVISRQIANSHTAFNVLCTLLWLPFIPVMVRIVSFIVPDKAAETGEPFLVQPDRKLLNQPVFAISMLGDELCGLGSRLDAVLPNLADAMQGRDEKTLAGVEKDFGRIADASETLTAYIAELFSAGYLTEEQAAEAAELMLVAESMGRIARRCGEAAQTFAGQLGSKTPFSPDAQDEVAQTAREVAGMFDAVLAFLGEPNDANGETLEKRRRSMAKRQNKVRKNHYRRIGSNRCASENKAAFDQLLLCFERANNECFNLIENSTELPGLSGQGGRAGE